MPRWLIVTAVVLAFLALVAAAVLKAVLEEPPEHARLPASRKRFGEQIAALAEAARTFPSRPCPDPGSPRTWSATSTGLGTGRRRPVPLAVFDHPALLGAEIVFGVRTGIHTDLRCQAVRQPRRRLVRRLAPTSR